LLSLEWHMKGKAEFLEHTADLKVRFTAESLDDLLTTAALTLGEYLYGIKPSGEEKIIQTRVEGRNDTERLVVALNEALYLLQTKRFLIRHVTVAPSGIGWNLEFNGRQTDLKPETEIKAATYHEARYREFKNMSEAVVVFDL
jgi:SHS2 domain-containing protein